MATNQNTSSQPADNGTISINLGPKLPYSADRLGLNFLTLIVWSAILTLIAALLIGGYLWAYIFQPVNVLQSSEDISPLRSQIPLEAMPVLPQSLAEQYDIINDGQREQLGTFGVSDLEGDVRIPIDDAMSLMLEQGAFQVREQSE
jgi:hypothetical protein